MPPNRILRSTIVTLFLALAVAACGSSNSPTPNASGSTSPSASAASPGASAPAASSSPLAGAAVNGMTCDATAANPGVSAKISLTLNDGSGTPVLPTANIGVLKTCKYWVYSDANGGLVVAAPLKPAVTLGDFISLWGLANSHDPLFVQFATAMIGPTRSITVNGKPVAGDKWQNMALADGMKIVASSAAAPSARPTPSASAGASGSPVPSTSPSPSTSPAPSPSAS